MNETIEKRFDQEYHFIFHQKRTEVDFVKNNEDEDEQIQLSPRPCNGVVAFHLKALVLQIEGSDGEWSRKIGLRMI